MKVLILNASPKSKGSASALCLSMLRPFLAGCEIKTCLLRGPRDDENVLALLPWAEAVVIAAPLYVDAAPAHVAAFLEKAEPFCRKNGLSFRLYAVSNGGFIEGHQNELHLRIYEAWCRRAGIPWCGGLGIGGGAILRWMWLMTVVFAVLGTVRLAMTAPAASPTAQIFLACYSSMLVTFALTLGALVSLAGLGWRIKRREQHKNVFTRCLMPSFLFIPVSDLFMLIAALTYKNLPHRLFRRQDRCLPREEESNR